MRSLESEIHEECGVFGVMTPEPCNVAGISYYGLYALQHRGQESCGIVVNDDGVFVSYKDVGLVSEVFSSDILSRMPKSSMAVAHTRYGTTGGTGTTASLLRLIIRKAEWLWHIMVISAMQLNCEMGWNFPEPFSILQATPKRLLILLQKRGFNPHQSRRL